MKAEQKFFTLVMMVLSVLLASMASKAQAATGEVELTCRAKAKETALQIYQGCVTESRAAKLQSIRDGYRSEIAAVKSKYEGLLKEVKAAPQTNVATPPPVKKAIAPGRAEKPVAGIAKGLPVKQFDNGPAQGIQTEMNEVTVVPSPAVDRPEVTDPDLAQIEDSSGF